MEDRQIVDLFWARSEIAIAETRRKYGKYCHTVAYNILRSREDAEECVNDVYQRLWEAIPPQRPERLSAFIGKIVRRLALDRYGRCTAQKRGRGQTTLLLDELAECLPDIKSTAGAAEDRELLEILNRFLASLPPQQRVLFMRRYWYADSIRDIARAYGMGESRVKMSLLRTRERLKVFLEKEGIDI